MFELVADGEPCTLAECPPGLFGFGDMVGLKDEYGTDVRDQSGLQRHVPAAYNEAGEFFWGGTKTHDDRLNLIVQPLAVMPTPLAQAVQAVS